MSKIIIDDTLRAKLNGLNSETEFCDESGKTLGHYVPSDLFARMLYAWAKSQITDAEIEAASREPGGRTLAEIWQSLGRT